MKTRLIALTLFCGVLTASAGSINWGFAGINKPATLITDAKDVAYTGNIYLILASNATSLEGLATQSAFEDALADITLGTARVEDGKISTTQTATHDSLVAKVDGGPNAYTFQVVVYDAANSKYYLSGTAEKNAYSLDGVANNTDAATSISFTKTMIGKSYSPSWSPAAVPEPSTAALALAGLALLLKRRRA